MFEAAPVERDAADSSSSDGEPERDQVPDDDGSSLGGTTLELGPRSPRSPIVSDDSGDEPMGPVVPSVPPMPTDSESSAEEEEFADSQRQGLGCPMPTCSTTPLRRPRLWCPCKSSMNGLWMASLLGLISRAPLPVQICSNSHQFYNIHFSMQRRYMF